MSLLSSADVSISLNFHLICRFSCNVPPLSQLNVASIHCKALKTIEIHCKARTSNVSTCCQFFRLLARDQPIVLKSHLDLFTNHFWICSPNVYAFVPKIGCGPGSNCEGGFLEQESPYLLLRCFHISPSTRRPSAAAAACLLVAAHTWGGLASDC